MATTTSIMNLLKVRDALNKRADAIKRMATVIDVLAEASFVYRDDHMSPVGSVDISTGYVLVEVKDNLCPFPLSGGACLNPLYVSHSTGVESVHLSTMSVGGYYADLEALKRDGLVYHAI